MTTIGSSTVTVTLSPSASNVTLNGTIQANGFVGDYNIRYGVISRTEQIYAAVFGTASTDFKIDNTGTVIGTGESRYSLGIGLGGIGSITNSGLIEGYEGLVMYGTQAGALIRNSGSIISTDDDGAAVILAGKGSVINSNLISGDIGIALAEGGAITNTGTGFIYGVEVGINAYGGRVAIVNDAVIGGEYGIRLDAAASITNASKGTITATYDGIYGYAAGAVTVVNSGEIISTGDRQGIYLEGAGSKVTNAKTGLIVGGVYVEGTGGQVDNQGTVERYGIGVRYGGKVINSGSISSDFDGIAGGPGATVENAKGGVIIAASNGIVAFAGSVYNAGTVIGDLGIAGQGAEDLAGPLLAGPAAAPSPTEVTNVGFVDGTSTDGVELDDAELNNKGTIIGYEYGVVGVGTAAITNSGQIIAIKDDGDAGVEMVGVSVSLVNAKSGTITAGLDSAGIAIQAQYGTVINDGVVSAGTGLLAAAEDGGALAVYNDGKITSGYTGAEVIYGYIYNAGKITASNPDGAGVGLSQATLDNAKKAVISGGHIGVLLDDFANSVSNAGTISGGQFGLVAYTGGNGITNAGLITSHYVGVGLYDGTSAFTNAGTVMANTGSHATGYDGVVATEASTVTNKGLVDHGVALYGASTLVNSGVITYGVYVEDGGTIFNTGTIGGHDGLAIDFADNDGNTLILGPSSVIEGSVELDGGVLELDGSGAGTLSIGSYLDIGKLDVDPGSTWVIDGTGAAVAVINDGLLKIGTGAAFTIDSHLDGHGEIELVKGAPLKILGTVGTGATLAFTGTGETLALGDLHGFHGTIAGFGKGDTVDTGITFSSITGYAFSGGELTITASSHTYTYAFSGKFKNETFSLIAAGDGTGIVLGSTKMDFATPSSAPVSGTALPDLSTAYTKAAPPVAATGAAASIVTSGVLAHIILTNASTLPTPVTLHG
jgi:hypothetical protein